MFTLASRLLEIAKRGQDLYTWEQWSPQNVLLLKTNILTDISVTYGTRAIVRKILQVDDLVESGDCTAVISLYDFARRSAVGSQEIPEDVSRELTVPYGRSRIFASHDIHTRMHCRRADVSLKLEHGAETLGDMFLGEDGVVLSHEVSLVVL